MIGSPFGSSMLVIDSAILDMTEWLCHKIQLLTGRTNVWLSVQLTNLSIIVYFVWVGLSFQLLTVGTRIGVGLFCATVLYVLTQTVFKVSIEASEKNAYRRVANGLRNPRRVRDALLRISFLFMSVVLSYPFLTLYIRFHVSVALLGYWLIVLTTVVLYALACDPLPPCPARLGVWLRGLATTRTAATESRPASRRQLQS
ncbi:MAG: hypothetical protein DMF89_26255 [Acidobacteria bacterium]|nr:MAG: hypothetical protein DMF89_26255 [Acidobacteriota bacterium]